MVIQFAKIEIKFPCTVFHIFRTKRQRPSYFKKDLISDSIWKSSSWSRYFLLKGKTRFIPIFEKIYGSCLSKENITQMTKGGLLFVENLSDHSTSCR